MAEIKGSKLSNYQKEQKILLEKVSEFKNSAEANICCLIFRDVDLIRDSNLDISEFDNETWRVCFEMLSKMILKEQYTKIDATVCDNYLAKHEKLREKFEEAGGFNLIQMIGKYLHVEDFDAYLIELRKWNCVKKLILNRFGIELADLPKLQDKTAEEIYEDFEISLNDIFGNMDNSVTSYDISDGIYELIDELDKGNAVGLPYNNMPILTSETGGQYAGSITLVGGLSNVGKSTFARTTTLPSIIEQGEKIVCFLNEDSLKKWQRELLVYISNNILKQNMQKHIVRDGKYTDETKNILKESAEWLIENTKNHTITILPFQKYETAKVIKYINKYANMGVKYFLLDTYKMDAGKVSETSWLDMQQKMVDINDAIKPEANNVHILITFQLSKSSARQRYYTQDNIGVAKNIIDPASTCIMIRNLFEDEYEGKQHALQVYKLKGKTQIPVKLDSNKYYQILFIVKNREGSANQHQIVIEHDMSRNCMREIGICDVPVDF